MKEENTSKVDEREFFYSIVLNVISKNYFYFYCRKSAYVLNLLFSHRNFCILLLFTFCLGACVPFSQRSKYPDLRKVAVESDKKFDSLVNEYFTRSDFSTKMNDSVLLICSDTSNETEHAIVQSLQSSENIGALVDNYKQTRGKLQYLHYRKSRNASLAEVSIAKIWAVLITIALIVLLILLIVFLFELFGDSSCLGCLVLFLIMGLVVLLFYGLLGLIFS